MNKDKLKEKVIKDGKEQHLSAQEYELMTANEKVLVKEILKDEKLDADEYEKKMKALWPKEFKPKPLTWRCK